MKIMKPDKDIEVIIFGKKCKGYLTEKNMKPKFKGFKNFIEDRPKRPGLYFVNLNQWEEVYEITK